MYFNTEVLSVYKEVFLLWLQQIDTKTFPVQVLYQFLIGFFVFS